MGHNTVVGFLLMANGETSPEGGFPSQLHEAGFPGVANWRPPSGTSTAGRKLGYHFKNPSE